ncbi:methylcytosine dioxygenase TET2 [Triplophysa rosa]|uniref:Methylcytosine dioxygenase TET n=1 Tax=Triplophysa rosa TaxID=992332 RepID=A0A9W7WZW1_TRIRA|nr:methylcytosine dioxygenase TET2 [Triplophysa rosa]KAI7811371.1 putative methylcytosine dioxygenase TET2 [Triplophysa rosa]
METEKTSHETEKSLTCSQISTTPQTDTLLAKRQNGDQSPDILSQQFNGDTNWSHFKPSTEVFSMKRQWEIDSSPANMQGMFDQSMYEMNGDTKHALGQQPKQLSTDLEINGDEDLGFPMHKPGHCELNHSKRNCNFPNGDIFSLSRNKQVPMSNGATKNPHSVKGTTGDLLEKTLSQYYPEHVSIAPQTNSSQVHQVTSNPNEHATPSPSFTSGIPSSPQTSASKPLAKVPPEVHYNQEFTQNGYHVSFTADQRQRTSTYPGCDLPEMGKHSVCQAGVESNLKSQTGINGCSPIQNDGEGLQNDTECLRKFKQDLSQESLPRLLAGSPLATERDGTFTSFNSPQAQCTQTGQQNLQFKMPLIDGSFQENRDLSLPQQQTFETQTVDRGLLSQACTADPQNQSSERDKPPTGQEKSTQMDWIDLNSAPVTRPSTEHSHTWDFCPSQGVQIQQNQPSQSEVINPVPPNNIPSQNFSKPTFDTNESQMQDCYKNSQPPTQLPHSSAPECQQRNSNVHGHFNTQYNKPQQLCKNDSDQIQSSGPPPVKPQQQPTISFPYQLPQDGHGLQVDPQSQGVSQSQTDEPILKRPKMEGCPASESQMLPLANNNFTFSDPFRSNVQLPSNEVQAMLGDAIQIQQNLQNTQCSQSTSKQHQNYQQPLHHRTYNDLEFFQSQHSHSQLSQVLNGPQTPTQTKTKAEFQEPCAQIQKGSLSNQGVQADMQKHAALRMHHFQKQGRQSPYHIRPDMLALKSENSIVVKQEGNSSECAQSQQRSILATMEQQLKQYQLSSVFERKSLVIKSPNKVKVEMAGAVTVLSTSTEGNIKEQCKPNNFTPPKKIQNGLQSFLESPMKLLGTPIKNLLDTPLKTQYDIPSCHCVDQISERDEGPYYTHLGAASTVAGIREIMEKRSGLTGSAIRIEKVVYTGKEGKSLQGCPIAKWVIRRASVDEKLLVLVRERAGHSCETSCIMVVIIIWEGISTNLADSLYSELSDTLTKHGALTNRRCALNEERTCACQGFEPDACGASFSFGCSWSMYYNGCKFARSKVPRKFKLLGDDPKEEEKLEQNLQGLATFVAPVYKKMAPDAYTNQVEHENRAPDCRLGQKEGRPFSGVTACLDFCAHAHRDLHNMQGGSTVVCTLTREDNREIGKIPEDEQLHVLPLYKASSTDEFGSAEAQLEKTKTGAIQVLSAFRRQVRMLSEPAKSCRQKKLEARRANKSTNPNTPNSKMDNTQQTRQKQSVTENLGQNQPITGPSNMKTDPGHPPSAHATHQQHQQIPHPNPVPPYAGPPYPRFSNAQVTLPNTSKLVNMHPQTLSPTSPYLPPVNVPNSYMNASTPYSRSLTPNPMYPGYQPNGGMPIDNYHPYYSPNIKHSMNMYQAQMNLPYLEQQYNAHQDYGVNYPPHYGEPRMPVNGYGTCNVRPGMHSMGHYRGYSPNVPPDAFPRPPSTHPHLDYAAVSKSSQFEAYAKPHMSQNCHVFPPNLDTLRMQNNKLNMHGANGISQVFPPFSNECVNPNQPPDMKLSNENVLNPQIKQEPQSQTLEQKEEDVWSDSEHNFLDPEIGGVAVAPSHGSIIIECAKRELHATTPLRKPDRNHPTRISLVFYQHKNLNEAKHGLAMWEAKMAEKAREKEEDAEKHGAENTSSKSSGKKAKREHTEPSEPSEPPYKKFVLKLFEKSMSCTTNTYVNTSPYAFTKVTGPYNHFQ